MGQPFVLVCEVTGAFVLDSAAVLVLFGFVCLFLQTPSLGEQFKAHNPEWGILIFNSTVNPCIPPSHPVHVTQNTHHMRIPHTHYTTHTLYHTHTHTHTPHKHTAHTLTTHIPHTHKSHRYMHTYTHTRHMHIPHTALHTAHTHHMHTYAQCIGKLGKVPRKPAFQSVSPQGVSACPSCSGHTPYPMPLQSRGKVRDSAPCCSSRPSNLRGSWGGRPSDDNSGGQNSDKIPSHLASHWQLSTPTDTKLFIYSFNTYSLITPSGKQS